MLPVLLTDAITRLYRPQVLRSAVQAVLLRARKALVTAAAAVLTAAVLLGLLFAQTKIAATIYNLGTPLRLQGASLIHVNPRLAEDYYWVVRQIADCDAFFMLPGQYSFYFWTDRPTPTLQSINNMIGLLTESQQADVVSDLAARSNLCIFTIPDLEQLFDRGQVTRQPPIVRFVADNFTVVAEHGPYRLLRRNDHTPRM
jgi:hypothetical protein